MHSSWGANVLLTVFTWGSCGREDGDFDLLDAGITPVSIKSVDSKKYGHVSGQDQGGGEYTGIQLFCIYGGTHPNCSMTQAETYRSRRPRIPTCPHS